jgi:hypothetical protein
MRRAFSRKLVDLLARSARVLAEADVGRGGLSYGEAVKRAESWYLRERAKQQMTAGGVKSLGLWCGDRRRSRWRFRQFSALGAKGCVARALECLWAAEPPLRR